VSQYYEESSAGTKAMIFGGALVVILIIAGIMWSLTTTRVSAGEVCVQTRFGKIQGTLDPGLHYHNSITMNTTCYSKRIKIYEVSLSEDAPTTSKADYKDFPIGARSIDAVDMNVALSVQYHVDTEKIVNSYEQGFRSMDELNEKIVKYHVRTIVPQVLAKYTAEQLYVGDLVTASVEIKTLLQERTIGQGVYVDNFELKRPAFNEQFTEQMKQRAINAETAKAKKAEQEIAKQEAERLRIEAEGQANQSRILAQGEADAAVTRAEAQALSETAVLKARAELIEQYPSLITWEHIATIKTANVVYLPNEVLPLLDIGGPNGTAKE
jgi:regulator of protease activity HflC (stomatin/prohibitin superfamily)